MASRGSGPAGQPPLRTVRALVVASQFGVTLAVSVGLGLFLGQWLDARLGTGIIFTLIGALLGLAAGIMGALRTYRAALGGPIESPHSDSRTPPSATHSAEDDHTRSSIP